MEKDPTITVGAGSIASYIFVKIEESADFAADSNISYKVADGWTPLDGVAGVYYREVEAVTEATPFAVLKDNKVTVANEFNPAEGSDYSLTFTAYGIQKDNLADAAAAWEALGTALSGGETTTAG